MNLLPIVFCRHTSEADREAATQAQKQASEASAARRLSSIRNLETKFTQEGFEDDEGDDDNDSVYQPSASDSDD